MNFSGLSKVSKRTVTSTPGVELNVASPTVPTIVPLRSDVKSMISACPVMTPSSQDAGGPPLDEEEAAALADTATLDDATLDVEPVEIALDTAAFVALVVSPPPPAPPDVEPPTTSTFGVQPTANEAPLIAIVIAAIDATR